MPFSRVKSFLVDELLDRLASHTKLSNLRVRQFSGIIFLCGGPTSDMLGPPQSARDYFLRYIREERPELSKRIFLAEVINTWATDMIRERYTPDLLTFESHVSGLASAVSLIVESPGSIAELGSFCLLSGIAERLMVVARDGWIDENSFIFRGPMTYLKESRGEESNPVFIYPWRVSWHDELKQTIPHPDDLAAEVEHFLEDLRTFEQQLPQRPRWRGENDGHVSLLISDLICLFFALKLGEIRSFLHAVGMTNVDGTAIKGHIFLLEKLNLVKRVSYRSGLYYVSASDRFFVELNLERAPAELTDRARFRFLVADWLGKGDKSRLVAIRRGRELAV